MGLHSSSLDKLLLKNSDDTFPDYTLPSDEDKSFSVYRYEAGESLSIGALNQNSIIFIMKGRIQVETHRVGVKIFPVNHMFFISRNYAPYEGVTLESTIFIMLNSENLLPFVDQVMLNKMVSKYASSVIELHELDIKKTMRYFLSAIIYYKLNNLHSRYLFDIKKREFVFLARTLYKRNELAQFFSPSILNYSEFRSEVLSKYSHAITVKTLAAKCFMTTKTFTRKFKSEFGTTPHKWLAEQKAKSLDYYLVHQTASMEEILREFHFSSVSELTVFCGKHHIKINIPVVEKVKRVD